MYRKADREKIAESSIDGIVDSTCCLTLLHSSRCELTWLLWYHYTLSSTQLALVCDEMGFTARLDRVAFVFVVYKWREM
jgi:hypothetical protein